MELFVTAARKKFRFSTVRGDVTVEDLWDMPLASKDDFNLDALALQLDASVDTKSFVKKRSTEDNISKQKFEIVKYVLDTKLAEVENAQLAKLGREKRQKLLAALENKEEAKLASMSEEDIRKELDYLGTEAR